MVDLKLSGILHDDAKIVHDAIVLLQGMVDTLERECMIRDGNKPATELYILINDLKNNVVRLEDISERIMRKADIDHFGPLSEYIRPYLGYKK